MALYDDFFSFGVPDMFNEGQSFRSVARFLRSEGLSFSDSRLRIFRDSVAGNTSFNLTEFSGDTIINEDMMTTDKYVECGKYGVAVVFNGHYEGTTENVQGRTYEIVGAFTNVNDFLDGYSESIAERISDQSDIVIDSISIPGVYKGKC